MSMRAACLLLGVLLLGSCHREDAGASSERSSNSKEGKSSGEEGVIRINESGQQKAGIRTQTVQLESVPEYLTVPGQIATNEDRTVHIGTYTDGRVIELNARPGDYVRKGALLARLHSHDVHETRAAYESALQDVQQKESALRYQEDLGARLKRLYDLKSASKGEVQRAETDVQSARTDLERAHIAVTKEVAHLTDILRMDPPQLQSIDERTENVPLIAPIAGTVIARNVTLGSVLEPGEEAFVVSDFSTVWMLAAVNERDMGKVSVGRKARVLTDAFPDRAFDGTVTRLGTELDQKTRTLAVRILLSNEKHLLRPGLFSTAQISQGPSRTALFVPELSLQDVNGGSVVFVKTGPDTFEPRSVQLGTRVRGHAEVLAGLKPGAAIAVEGSFAVKSQMLRAQIGE